MAIEIKRLTPELIEDYVTHGDGSFVFASSLICAKV